MEKAQVVFECEDCQQLSTKTLPIVYEKCVNRCNKCCAQLIWAH